MTTATTSPVLVIEASDLERALLGSVLVYPGTGSRTLSGVEAEDFHEPRHRVVFQVIDALLQQGAEPTAVMVNDLLRRQGAVRFSAGAKSATLLATMLHEACQPATAHHHREALIRVRWRREAVAFADRLHKLADKGSDQDLHRLLVEAVAVLGAQLARLNSGAAP